MIAPDEAIVMFRANGYTTLERVIAMLALCCAEITRSESGSELGKLKFFVSISRATRWLI
jgi:hypothetical protein